jgi:predicted nuclease with TOPRIM domain
MGIESTVDTSIIGGIVALITAIALAVRQLHTSLQSDAVVSAQDKANKTLFEMLETKLQSQNEELIALRSENNSLRNELRIVHEELISMKAKFEECLSRLNVNDVNDANST